MDLKRADVWWITLVFLFNWITSGHLQEPCVRNLPTFRDQGSRSPSLIVGIQALVPEYEFTCSGSITQWGLSTEMRGKHRVDLQVWRPMQGEGVYHLVGTNSFNTRPEMGQKLLYLFPNATNQIQAKPGDVVGFYLEDDARVVDDFAIQYKLNATGVSVQYKQEDHPLEIIQASTLPVQFLNVAPIILVEIAEETTPRTTTTPTPTIENPTNENSTTDLTATIAGTLVGIVVFLVVIVTLTSIAACVRVRRNRAGIEQLTTKPVYDRTATNPNYTGDVSVMVKMNINPAYGQGQFRNVHGYEVPIVTSSNATLHCHPSRHVRAKPTNDACNYETSSLETSGQHEYEELV